MAHRCEAVRYRFDRGQDASRLEGGWAFVWRLQGLALAGDRRPEVTNLDSGDRHLCNGAVRQTWHACERIPGRLQPRIQGRHSCASSHLGKPI